MLKHCSFGEESHATSLLSQVWSKNTYLFPHPGDFRASAHLFRGQTLLLQGYGNIRNATWCQWLPSCWRQRHGHTSTKELSLLGLSHTRSPTRLNLCYTEEATEATHRLERQYNACANRKVTVSSGQPESYCFIRNTAYLFDELTNGVSGQCVLIWFLTRWRHSFTLL